MGKSCDYTGLGGKRLNSRDEQSWNVLQDFSELCSYTNSLKLMLDRSDMQAVKSLSFWHQPVAKNI